MRRQRMAIPRSPAQARGDASYETTPNARFLPPPINHVEETGLSKLWLQDLALKTLYFRAYGDVEKRAVNRD